MRRAGDDVDVRNDLDDMRKAVDAELDRLLAADGSRLLEAMRYAVLGGGKRFRPLVLLAAGEAFGASRPALLPYACAVELIHNYSLVHDDLPAMDNDDLRRGRPSCHKAFGEGLALLAGDGLLSLAFEVIAGAPSLQGHMERKDRALREIASASGIGGMIKGQWLDISLRREDADADAFIDMIGKKTGELIKAAANVGAVLAGAPAPVLAAIGDYGTALGLAFQLRDDLADSGRSGSPSGLDAVAVFGREGARARLEECVAGALAALDKGKIASAELRHLAGTLSPGRGMSA
ncbi:MAG: polyprenyl synthetase family protein [Candidatus Aminicenantales bacterium]